MQSKQKILCMSSKLYSVTLQTPKLLNSDKLPNGDLGNWLLVGWMSSLYTNVQVQCRPSFRSELFAFGNIILKNVDQVKIEGSSVISGGNISIVNANEIKIIDPHVLQKFEISSFIGRNNRSGVDPMTISFEEKSVIKLADQIFLKNSQVDMLNSCIGGRDITIICHNLKILNDNTKNIINDSNGPIIANL